MPSYILFVCISKERRNEKREIIEKEKLRERRRDASLIGNSYTRGGKLVIDFLNQVLHEPHE